jgi:hypothetical protein
MKKTKNEIFECETNYDIDCIWHINPYPANVENMVNT